MTDLDLSIQVPFLAHEHTQPHQVLESKVLAHIYAVDPFAGDICGPSHRIVEICIDSFCPKHGKS